MKLWNSKRRHVACYWNVMLTIMNCYVVIEAGWWQSVRGELSANCKMFMRLNWKYFQIVYPPCRPYVKNDNIRVLGNSHICLAVTVKAESTFQCRVKCHEANVTKALHIIWMLGPFALQVEINKLTLCISLYAEILRVSWVKRFCWAT